MPATIVVGTQWGDEGKGKFTDLIAKEMTMVVRYQGGHNAGHTLVVDGESFALQLVPSGVLYDHIVPVIGNGVVVDPVVLLAEMDTLASKGVDCSRLSGLGQRPHDLPLPPGARPSHRTAPREEQTRHHQAGDRAHLRRQGVARSGSGCRTCRDPKIFREKLPFGGRGEEPHPGQGLQPPRLRCRRAGRPLPRRGRSPARAPHRRLGRPGSRGAGGRTITCSSKAPRPPSSTSTTAPIPT